MIIIKIYVIIIIGQKSYKLAKNLQILLDNDVLILDAIFLKEKLLKKFIECIFKQIISYFLPFKIANKIAN